MFVQAHERRGREVRHPGVVAGFVFDNAVIFDGVTEELTEGHVVVADGVIQEITAGPAPAGQDGRIDCDGRFLMPGLLDLHFHAYSPTFDMLALDRMPKPLLTAYALRHLEGALQRGFTTVRDPGGGDVGLALAVDRGLISGPRFLYGGPALSQTGGHGDMRHAQQADVCACSYAGVIGRVVDGVDDIRRVARDELRKGADHLKVFISGGVASPSDPMWMPQFTDDEIRAVVEEAATRRKYVAAHCHTDDGARRCVENGVRSIEHGTEITVDTARLIAQSGTTYVVPTLAVIHELLEHGPTLGLFAESLEKVQGVLPRMLASIENCRRAGVKVGLGTDLFGTPYHHMQASELRFRGEVDKPVEVLRSATSVNAEIVQRAGELGVVAPGARADLLVLESNPLDDLAVFERYESDLRVIVKDGEVVKNTL